MCQRESEKRERGCVIENKHFNIIFAFVPASLLRPNANICANTKNEMRIDWNKRHNGNDMSDDPSSNEFTNALLKLHVVAFRLRNGSALLVYSDALKSNVFLPATRQIAYCAHFQYTYLQNVNDTEEIHFFSSSGTVEFECSQSTSKAKLATQCHNEAVTQPHFHTHHVGMQRHVRHRQAQGIGLASNFEP